MNKALTPYHSELKLKNFTAFADVQLDFVPGVNVFIGENGTGKTHIMKALYSAQKSWSDKDPFVGFEGVFQSPMKDLVRLGESEGVTGQVSGLFHGTPWAYAMHSNLMPSAWSVPGPIVRGSLIPAFIPAIDMMGHTKGFVSTYDNFKIDFDLTHREIVSLLLSPELRVLPAEHREMVAKLEYVIGGSVVLEGERFYLNSEKGNLSMPSVAEGLRKIATLIRLIQCGWLRPGATLFWDEPEVNLNPILMDEVVGAILTLGRSGVQVFLATHSYVILKELEVQSTTEDEVRFFALEPTESGTRVTSASTYLELRPNKIEQQYGDLYDRRIEKLSKVERAS